jgi:glutamate dehydrogenase (NAD(P)+)
MKLFLSEKLPESTWQNRLIRENGLCFMEFGPLDVERLARLDIGVDKLGPTLVVCMWDDDSPLEIGGYLVVDNLAMGRPAMGGIRMLPDVTPAAIHNLARGMTLKNAAANLPYGGGKAGIVADRNQTPEEHSQIIRGFARLIYRYHSIYLPGPDVGTNDADMKTIAIENGLDNALSKPLDMGGNRIDELGAAAGGVIIALDELIAEMDRLAVLPQFAKLTIPPPDQLTVLIQGFGAVGAHATRILGKMLPAAKVIGVSDLLGYLYEQSGLPVEDLFSRWVMNPLVTRPYYFATKPENTFDIASIKFSTCADDLLRESAFCFIPAAPIANYLDTDPSTNPSMTVDRMGTWQVIIEGANTYSPDPNRKIARARMERAVYRQRGVLIATDYLVNSGGVIFAAQEHLLKTPDSLRIPQEMIGNREAVNAWLQSKSEDFESLSHQRLVAAELYRDQEIRRNMRELIDLLVTDADMLPCEAAELISIRRIAARESDRTARDLMETIPTIVMDCDVRAAAEILIQSGSSILAVVSKSDELVGVVTDWDITRATATGCGDNIPIKEIMTSDVITIMPGETIVEILRKLEYHEISAMPVVDGKIVQGMVSTDILAHRSLLRLLQGQTE